MEYISDILNQNYFSAYLKEVHFYIQEKKFIQNDPVQSVTYPYTFNALLEADSEKFSHLGPNFRS